MHVLSTAGATVMAIAYLLPVLYLIWSLRYGRPAPPNPWDAAGLEWTTISPPEPHNFDQPPQVTGEPYAYDAEGDASAAVEEGRR
jgi:cytochrome c oxidase subunit 1